MSLDQGGPEEQQLKFSWILKQLKPTTKGLDSHPVCFKWNWVQDFKQCRRKPARKESQGAWRHPGGQVSDTPKMVFRTIYAQLSTEAKFHPMTAASRGQTLGVRWGCPHSRQDLERQPPPSHVLVTYQEFSTKKNRAAMIVILEASHGVRKNI